MHGARKASVSFTYFLDFFRKYKTRSSSEYCGRWPRGGRYRRLSSNEDDLEEKDNRGKIAPCMHPGDDILFPIRMGRGLMHYLS